MIHWKQIKLENGETFITSEKGSSMVPLIKSGQKHELSPTKWQWCIPGDIVFCKVKGRYYTHKVLNQDDQKGLLIGNNKGGINGWTRQVFGRVTKIL